MFKYNIDDISIENLWGLEGIQGVARRALPGSHLVMALIQRSYA